MFFLLVWFVIVLLIFWCGGIIVLKSLGMEFVVGVVVGGFVLGVLCCEMGVLGCDVGVVIVGFVFGIFGIGIGVVDVFGGFEVEDLDGNVDVLFCVLGCEFVVVLVKIGNVLIIVEVEGLLVEEIVFFFLIVMLVILDVCCFFGLWDLGVGMVFGVLFFLFRMIEFFEVEFGI